MPSRIAAFFLVILSAVKADPVLASPQPIPARET